MLPLLMLEEGYSLSVHSFWPWGGWEWLWEICLCLKDIFLQPVCPASQRVDVSSDMGGLTFGVKPT